MTYSPVRSMFRHVSFLSRTLKGSRSPRDGLGPASGAAPTRSGWRDRLCWPTQMRQVGGSEPTPVKKENGARFADPSSLRVDTHAMGRGTIVPTIQ